MDRIDQLKLMILELERRLPTTRPARRWEWYEERIDIQTITPGTAAPSLSNRQWGGTASSAPTLDYSASLLQFAHHVWHAPHDLNPDQPAHIHAMWVPGAGYTSGNYYIYIEHSAKLENGAVGTGTVIGEALSVTPANATNIIETEFTSDISIQPDGLLYILFGRIGNDVLDTADDVLQLLFIEVKYARWLDGRRPDVPFELSR